MAVTKERLMKFDKNERFSYANWSFNERSRVIFIDELCFRTGDDNRFILRRGKGYEEKYFAHFLKISISLFLSLFDK